MFSAVWGLEGYYDATVAKREADRLLMKNVERSYTTSVSADGVEQIEFPLRYDKCVSYCTPLIHPHHFSTAYTYIVTVLLFTTLVLRTTSSLPG